MSKSRHSRENFLYDKSDLIIAFIILLIAALIIGSRVTAIMNYPKTAVVTVEQGVTDHDEDNAADSGSSADSVTINITDGDSTSSVAKKLADEGLIDDAKAFEKLMEKNKLQGFLVTGDHSIPKNTSNASIIKIITGKTIKK